MKSSRIWIISAVCLSMTLLSGCKRGQNEETTEQQEAVAETFVGTGREGAGTSSPAEAATHGNGESSQPTSAGTKQQGPKTNDKDPNLRGYTYAYDKNTKYEDGLFDDTPDYIAIPAKMKDKPEQLLFRKTYALSYNRETKQANWVAWHLTKAHTYGKVERMPRAFHDDDDVPNSTHFYDYNKSKQYDRGHLCPAGDNKWDKDAMYETFLMSNVCPQYHELNSGVWNDIEIKCRDWARQEGDVYIVAGPIFYPHKRNRERIGGSKIPVPDAFFKVVVSNKHKGKGIGFMCENRHGSYDLNDYSMTIDEIERIAGIDFFPALPDEMEEQIESKIGRFR